MSTQLKYILITVLGAVLFLPFLGQVNLFDWDEINFAECAREMLVTKNYLQVQINYEPFWEKPPLFIWLQVLSMKMFGVNEYAARFPNALAGIVTLLSLFYIGKRVVNEKMAMWWVIIYATTWLPHFYFKSGIIDPVFNLFIFLSFFQVYLIRQSSRGSLHALLAGIFLGLAVMTKGPAAVLIALLAFVAYVVVKKGLNGIKLIHIFLIALAALFTTSIWFGLEIINNGFWFVNEFITYQIRLFKTQDAGHGGPFVYHFIILLLGCFPASIFLFQYIGKRFTADEKQKDFTKWMWILFWVVLLLFSIVKTKIVHYSSLCYFPLTYLAALAVYNLDITNAKPSKLVKGLILSIGSIIAIAIAALPLVGVYKTKLIPYIKDDFAVANFQADVSWSFLEVGWGLLLLIAVWVSVYAYAKNFKKAFIGFSIVQLIILQVTVIHFTPKVEAFSQRAAIDYFKSLQGKDVYIYALSYKSYAHLFYSRKQPQANPKHNDKDWLLKGDIDKPAYFICKINKAQQYRDMPNLEEIGSKNGFVFFRRMP